MLATRPGTPKLAMLHWRPSLFLAGIEELLQYFALNVYSDIQLRNYDTALTTPAL
jgi:hypothetical protein